MSDTFYRCMGCGLVRPPEESAGLCPECRGDEDSSQWAGMVGDVDINTLVPARVIPDGEDGEPVPGTYVVRREHIPLDETETPEFEERLDYGELFCEDNLPEECRA